MAKLSKPARRKRVAMRKIAKSGAARSAYKVARKVGRSGARSVHKRAGALLTHAASGNAEGLKNEAMGVGRDMRRTGLKATKKAIRR